MKFEIGTGGEVKVFLVYKGIDLDHWAFPFAKKTELMEGKPAQVYACVAGKDRVIFVGMGDEDKVTLEGIRKSFYALGKETMKWKIESIDVQIPEYGHLSYAMTVEAAAEGLLQSEHAFEKFLSEKKLKPTLKTVFLTIPEGQDDVVEAGIGEAKILMEGIQTARELANEPAINMYPEVLASAAQEQLEGLGIEVQVFDKAKIEELGMKAFLAVARGSAKEPRFIVMSYQGDPESEEKLALVGKGLTYDSGGYCIKPASGMKTMHTDMAGSASVIGALKSIAKAGIKRNVIGIVAACENMISGDAYKTGDIIGSMSGKTIEVNNTDAEGRLTLADALWYAATVAKADKIVDIATLTGACMVALGKITTGAVTNNQDLMAELKDAADLAGEKLWELPSFDEYKEIIKGTFADLSNTGKEGAGAGAITAGLFLEEFVDDVPWVHLDIAGTSYTPADYGYLSKGATGVPVKTLYYLAKGS